MAAKGFYVDYGNQSTFLCRIADNIDNTGMSPIDNFISPKYKKFIFKNGEINSEVKVEFLQLDNLWHYPNGILKSPKTNNL